MRALIGIGLRAAILAAMLLGAAPANAAHLTEALESRLGTGAGQLSSEQDERDLAMLLDFYRARGMAPVWVGEAEGVSARARILSEVIAAADLDGLDPADYGASRIRGLLAAQTPEDLATLEVGMSLGLVRFASDLAAGRLEPSQVDPEHYIFPEEVDRAAVIRDAAANAEDIRAFVAGYQPQQDQYRRLKATYARYDAIAGAGGWPAVPEGPTLKPGMTDDRVVSLRARLRAEGDLAPEQDLSASGGDARLFDDELVAAAVRFQNRHGLEPDAKIGPKTLQALNVTAGERVEQILINMERRRWMSDDLGQRYVFVNLADFHLKVVDEPKTIFVTRVVVGKPFFRTPVFSKDKPFFRTPVFSKDMTYVVVNPYWNVPPSIARNEILPKIKEDPGYLAAKNFELLSDWSNDAAVIDPATIDWASMTRRNFTYKVRQGPGEGNALGRLKFMFPNPFNIYLHDTPSKTLFERYERTFSHGCVRVQHPRDFAAVVLGGQSDWDPARIEAAIASEIPQVVSLAEPLPVHITYLTAWTNKDGTVHFRDDVYGRDVPLRTALLGPGSND